MASNQSAEKSIRKWFGGISDDVREQTVTDFAISKHFDTITSPNRLTPYRSSEADEDTTFKVRNFLYEGAVFYGLGRTTDDLKTKLYYKDPSPISGTWAVVTNGVAANNDTTYPDSFGVYQGDLYGIRQGPSVWQYDVSGTTFTQAFLSLAANIITVAPPVHHPISDRLFLAYNNRIAQVDSGTGTDGILILPSNLAITSMCPFGDSLAIAVTSASGGQAFSRVYLWNMIDPTPYQMIDWGQESLKVLENVDNQLIGISIAGNSDFSFNQILYVKEWSGGDVIKIKEVPLDAKSYTLGVQKVLSQNRLYFVLDSSSATPEFSGIWVVGRVNENYPFQTTIDRKFSNDTSVTSVQGIYKLGDYMWVAHSNDGQVDRTDDTANYTATSFVETQKYNGDDPSRKKLLRGVALSYVTLPTAGAPVLKYRKDDETSYTTIFTETTDSAMSTIRTAVAATTSLPSYNEIQFRVESTGGAQITEIRFAYDFEGSPMD